MTDYERGFAAGVASMPATVQQHIDEARAQGFKEGVEAAALLSDDAGAAEGPMRRRVACRATCVEAKP